MAYSPAALVEDMRRATARSCDPGAIVKALTGPAQRLDRERDWIEPRFYSCEPGAAAFAG